ncbi:alanine racemase [Phenylobacterium sp.]|uniref:alanine racemase n=1 Tax=Phenylobacterium sp. TaxID=1871053 RepID=UPI0012264C3C|nr:alanine racemase [Phenylobacterium sp.]THD65394.1 MAG: alanine racemase [Phenylobacterium sp.]
MADTAAARLTIDLDALAHNHAVLCAQVNGAEVAPVLKSDAYGLGAGPVGRRLWAEGARRFFVARASEGEALRAALTPDRPATIYVLDGMTEGSAARLAAAGLTPVLCSLSQIALATAQATRDGRSLPVALNIDTGMSRQGLTAEETRAVVQSLDRLRGLEVNLVMSHLGSAAEPDNPRNARQLSSFLDAKAHFPRARASLSASAGIFLGADYRFDLVRPGISLFGGGALERPDARLRAVAALTAPILDVRNLRPGDVVGYGDSVRIETPTRVAVVAAGYTDGVIRAARGAAHAWFAGAPRRILIINMDILVIELGDTCAEMGDPVELLGSNSLLDDLAAAGGTVAHEILVRLSRRAERVYVGEA